MWRIKLGTNQEKSEREAWEKKAIALKPYLADGNKKKRAAGALWGRKKNPERRNQEKKSAWGT